MSFLLKIVDGPMKGAEVALQSGSRVSFGRGDGCDIVIADQSLAEEAFVLEVGGDGVAFAGGEKLEPFVIYPFGTTAVAIGPSEGEWEALRPKPVPVVEEEKPEEPEEKPVEEPVAPEPVPEKPKQVGTRPFTWILFLILLILFALVMLHRHLDVVTVWVERYRENPVEAKTVVPCVPLPEIAQSYGLKLDSVALNGKTCNRLSGNLRLRTERLAIRALAIATDPAVRFDLTDDESLLVSSDALLFACTDGAIKAIAASNRVVTLAGYAPSSAALEAAIRALDADVPQIVRLDTSRVAVGGIAPEALRETPFVKECAIAPAPAKSVQSVPAVARKYSVAGILTVPYPCVVMANGQRMLEGADIGGAVIEKIEAGCITLRQGDSTFTVKP